jgi:hypothetical protein
MRVSDDLEQYRKRARNCLDMARTLADRRRKLIALDMAQAWLKLAEQAEKNRTADIVYETPPRPESPRPDRS